MIETIIACGRITTFQGVKMRGSEKKKSSFSTFKKKKLASKNRSER